MFSIPQPKKVASNSFKIKLNRRTEANILVGGEKKGENRGGFSEGLSSCNVTCY